MTPTPNATEAAAHVATLRRLFPDWTIVYLPTALAVERGILAVREQPDADYTKAADFVWCQGTLTTLGDLVSSMRYMEALYQEAQSGTYSPLRRPRTRRTTLAGWVRTVWHWRVRAR